MFLYTEIVPHGILETGDVFKIFKFKASSHGDMRRMWICDECHHDDDNTEIEDFGTAHQTIKKTHVWCVSLMEPGACILNLLQVGALSTYC